MAQSAAMPPAKVHALGNVGANPLAKMSGAAHSLGVNPPGPPAAVRNAPRQPNWFAPAGGGSPTEGFMGTVGVPPTSRAGPPSAAMMQPTPDEPIPNSMGMQTNHSAPYAKIARALNDEIMSVSQLLQIVVTKKERQEPTLRRKGHETRRYTILNIPALNYFLALNTRKDADRRDVRTVDEFLEGVDANGKATRGGGWGFEGVVRSEEGAEDITKSRWNVTEERLFNSVVRGYAHTFNVFGPEARPGTSLFLIVKQCLPAKNATFRVRPWDPTTLPIAAGELTNKPFQFEFYGNYRHDSPPLNKLMYIDDFGYRQYGRAIYIGKVSTHSPVNPQYSGTRQMCAGDLGTILTQPQFHIFVDW